MNPAKGGAVPLRRAGVLPAKPCQPVEFTSTGCFSIRGPRGMYSAGLDGDIVLFRFNV